VSWVKVKSYLYINKQPIDCDAQLAATQTGRECQGNVWGIVRGEYPRGACGIVRGKYAGDMSGKNVRETVRIPIQDYKALMICAILVNFSPTIVLVQPAELYKEKVALNGDKWSLKALLRLVCVYEISATRKRFTLLIRNRIRYIRIHYILWSP